MPLHPQIQPIIDLINAGAAEAPPLAEQTVEMRREAYLDLVSVIPPGPDMSSVEDRVVPGPSGDITVRIYRPLGHEAGSGGVVVFYHGGGWCIGDLTTHDEVCRQLADQSGSVVVAVDYRLAPEAPFPAAVDDAWAGLQWVREQAADLVGASSDQVSGPDADSPKSVPVAVCGDSAGANLSAVMALMARNAGQELAAQLLVYPAVDFRDPSIYPSQSENSEGYVLTRESMDWFEAHYQVEASDWRASVVVAESHAGLAPALVITAEFDPLRDEGEAYAQLLEEAGVSTTSTRYDGMAHIFFQLGPLVEPGAEAVTQVALAAREAFARTSN